MSLGTAFYRLIKLLMKRPGIRRSLKRAQEAQREFARNRRWSKWLLIGCLKADALTKGTSEYQKVKDEILSKYGQYLNGLSAEIRVG
ncbi:MAG: hypothetical protein ACLU4N_03520 [Butyricimonas faecihominis]